MNIKKQDEGCCGPPFPEDLAERLERLIKFAGMTREEFAQRVKGGAKPYHSTFLTGRDCSLCGRGHLAFLQFSGLPGGPVVRSFCAPGDVPLQDTFDCFFDYGFHGVEVISEPVYLANSTDDDVRPAGAPFEVVFL